MGPKQARLVTAASSIRHVAEVQRRNPVDGLLFTESGVRLDVVYDRSATGCVVDAGVRHGPGTPAGTDESLVLPSPS